MWLIARHDRRAHVLLALLIALSLASDLLMMPMFTTIAPGPPRMPTFPVTLSLVGCVLAQGSLLAAWLAWGDLPFGKRLLWHWIIAALFYLVWVSGFWLCRHVEFAAIAPAIGLTVPLVSLAAQLPLWTVRYFFGWRLARGEMSEQVAAAPLAIRDLMSATVLVALTLAIARVAPIPDAKERWPQLTAMFILATVISAMTLLPTAPLLLREPFFRRGLIFASLYAGFWIALLWSIVLIVLQQGRVVPPPLAFVVGVTGLITSYAGTVMLAAACARALGYRLIWGQPRRSPFPAE